MRTYRVPPKPTTDDGHLELLARVIFIMGFNYALVEERWPLIRKAFHSFRIRETARLTPDDVLGKPGMINNRRKIERILANARECERIVTEYGSMQAWVKAVAKQHAKDPLFSPSLEDECQRRFAGIGETTREWIAYVFRDGKKKAETVRA